MLALFVVILTTGFTVLALVSLLRATGRARRPMVTAGGETPISVLKPLCGADDSLEENLASFFQQAWPTYELVFGVHSARDPAVAIVERLAARFPNVPCRLVVHDGRRGINPKVANLRGMLDVASHDLLVISDSNVRVRPGYLAGMLGHYASGRVGMITSLFAGVGERSFGAALDNLHLNGMCAGAIALSQELGGAAAAVGKSMMFSRARFESLGGFESVATLLAEDYVMGRMFQEAGYEVRLCDEVIDNVSERTTVRGFMRRHLRWGLMRSRLMPFTYALEPLGNPMATGLALSVLTGAAWPVAWAVLLTMTRDTVGWLRMRGRAGLVQVLPLGPVKDVAMLGVWALAPFLRRVTWRANQVRVGAGTRLYAARPMMGPLPLEPRD